MDDLDTGYIFDDSTPAYTDANGNEITADEFESLSGHSAGNDTSIGDLRTDWLDDYDDDLTDADTTELEEETEPQEAENKVPEAAEAAEEVAVSTELPELPDFAQIQEDNDKRTNSPPPPSEAPDTSLSPEEEAAVNERNELLDEVNRLAEEEGISREEAFERTVGYGVPDSPNPGFEDYGYNPDAIENAINDVIVSRHPDSEIGHETFAAAHAASATPASALASATPATPTSRPSADADIPSDRAEYAAAIGGELQRDGTIISTNPDGSVQISRPDGSSQVEDGSGHITRYDADGNVISETYEADGIVTTIGEARTLTTDSHTGILTITHADGSVEEFQAERAPGGGPNPWDYTKLTPIVKGDGGAESGAGANAEANAEEQKQSQEEMNKSFMDDVMNGKLSPEEALAKCPPELKEWLEAYLRQSADNNIGEHTTTPDVNRANVTHKLGYSNKDYSATSAGGYNRGLTDKPNTVVSDACKKIIMYGPRYIKDAVRKWHS